MNTFHCDNCNKQVFFENTVCGHCGWMLGYQPELQAMASFSPLPADPAADSVVDSVVDSAANAGDAQAVIDGGAVRWRGVKPANEGRIFRQCVNYWRENVCNWMIDERDAHELCASCRLTRVIPSMDDDGQNRVLWSRLETAKRRLLHSLWTLRLQPVPKVEEDDVGLAFEFLEDMPHGQRVLTGHADGVITINIAEADPAYREQARVQMAEPYRTLLGHFRHESGHYYFDQLVVGTSWLEPFRSLFGDEREDYGMALQQHYEQGPSEGWEQRFVSAYASSHPWEDWAETWAHYLHMFDTLETAYACGVQLKPRHAAEQTLEITAPPVRAGSFDELVGEWFALTYVLNSLNRSIGMPDSYPFALTTPVLEKLRFVHDVVSAPRNLSAATGARQVTQPVGQ